MGIGPTCPAWKAGALPLSYTRDKHITVARDTVPTKNRTNTIDRYRNGRDRVPTYSTNHTLGEGGFEPPKAEPPDLQSGPFGRSGIPPVPPNSANFQAPNVLELRRLCRRSGS